MPVDTPGEGVLRTSAPAKINWTLEVLGKRVDGYHEVRSVMQTITLADSLELHPAAAYSLTVDGPEAEDAGDADKNLVTRAARAFPDNLARRPAAFRLTKAIPAAAGLGGGSSDAAAALRLLARSWGLAEGLALHRAAAALGSDVAFFLRGGVQLAAGRGETLEPLPDPPPVRLVLLTPPLTLTNKTARLYAALRPEHFTDGAATARLAERLRSGGAPGPVDYVNAFDAVADAAFPGLAEYRRRLERVTGTRALLAGAGPTLFAVCAHDPAEALERERAATPGRWHVVETSAARALGQV